MKKYSLLIVSMVLLNLCFSQVTLRGTIRDKSTELTIPYTSIGLVGTYNGTLSDANGNFVLAIPHFKNADTLRISAIGYKTISVNKSAFDNFKNGIILLEPAVYELTEVKIKPRSNKILGTANYTKKNCTAFAGIDSNWIGKQAAIQANNKPGVKVYLETFGFYIIKNLYADSLTFRIMLYEVNENGYPGATFLQKPIVFKTNVSQGEVLIDLKPYSIVRTGDFFISLECLEDKMQSAKFCFAGSIKVPSYFKTSAFNRWGKVKGGGADFNVKVSYVK